MICNAELQALTVPTLQLEHFRPRQRSFRTEPENRTELFFYRTASVRIEQYPLHACGQESCYAISTSIPFGQSLPTTPPPLELSQSTTTEPVVLGMMVSRALVPALFGVGGRGNRTRRRSSIPWTRTQTGCWRRTRYERRVGGGVIFAIIVVYEVVCVLYCGAVKEFHKNCMRLDVVGGRARCIVTAPLFPTFGCLCVVMVCNV